MATKIKYKGKIISLNPGDIIALNTKNKLIEDDVTVEVGISSGSGSGECSGEHIIEVDTLPTENINETDLYKCGDSYYKSGVNPFSDLILVYDDGTTQSFDTIAPGFGMTYSFNIIPTKITENIQVSDNDTIYHWYYIEDENDVFLYMDPDSTGTNDWYTWGELADSTFNGIISDISEATTTGYYTLSSLVWTSYSNGQMVVEVDELPTENIDSDALYKYNDGLHQYKAEFTDIIVLNNGEPLSLVAAYVQLIGAVFELYYVKTIPTENIVVSGETSSGILFACYYVEDVNDIFVYGDFEKTGTNTWNSFTAEMDMTNGGMISDTSQATDASAVYALGERGWKSYVIVSGSITITENSTVDVKDKESVTVAVPSVYSYQTVAELPTDATNGSIAIVFGGE